MIGLLRGPAVLRTGEGEVIVDVAGVGYRVTVTPATAAALVTAGPKVEQTALRAHARARGRHRALRLRARRRAPMLRGAARFARGRTGAGPLHHGPASRRPPCRPPSSRTTSTRSAPFPGVGRKTAARLLIELKSRLDLPDLSFDPTGVVGERLRRGRARASRTARSEARAALNELGYAPEEIRGALDGLRDDVGRGRDAPSGPARAGWPVSPQGAPGGPGHRRRGARGLRGRRRGRTARHRSDPVGPRRGDRRGRPAPTLARGVRRPGPAGRAPRDRAAGRPPAPPGGGPHPLRRPARTGQDLAGRHRGHRNGGRSAHHRRSRPDPGR